MNGRGKIWGAAVAVVLLALAAAPAGAATDVVEAATGHPCAGPEVLLVHDLAETADVWDPLVTDLGAAGWCPVAVDWGRPRTSDVPLPVGGLTGVEPAAEQLALNRGWIGSVAASPRAQVAVVAKGVGALVVQRALQVSSSPTPPISALVTLGPVWNGTNLLGIADAEDLSRRLGTFDAVLAWERTWMDGICEGCREVVRGSDLLVRLHGAGIRTPGVAYTDIVTPTDLLIHPPTGQSPHGTDVRHLAPYPAAGPVWHGELGREPGSRALVVDALGPT